MLIDILQCTEQPSHNNYLVHSVNCCGYLLYCFLFHCSFWVLSLLSRFLLVNVVKALSVLFIFLEKLVITFNVCDCFFWSLFFLFLLFLLLFPSFTKFPPSFFFSSSLWCNVCLNIFFPSSFFFPLDTGSKRIFYCFYVQKIR